MDIHNNPNSQKQYSHRFHLPKIISRSGQKPSRNARINFVIISVLLIFCFVDLVITAITMGRMYPGVSIAGKDVSFLTRSETYSLIKSQNLKRNFTIKVGDKVFTTTSGELGANYDTQTTVDTAYSVGRDQSLPSLGLTNSTTKGQIGFAYNIDQVLLRKFTTSIIQSVGHDAVNASLQVNNGIVETTPDQDGLRIDQKYLNKILAIALSDARDQNISLEPTVLKADILASQVGTAKQQAETLLTKNVTLSYDGKTYGADKTAIGHMIVFTSFIGIDGKPQLKAEVSSEQVAGFVQSTANRINIKPVNKKVTASNGTQTVEREGVDGLAVSQQPAINAIVAALNANTDVNFSFTASPVAFRTEVSQNGALGGLNANSYIEVSLNTQRLWAWQDGQVVFSTPITSGASGYGFGTQTGQFSIYAKERSRYLNGSQYGWSYNVFVDYWMPFNGGVGLHDADWRSSFGGQDYINGGSHGCVNMAKGSAAFLYSWAGVGTPVWIHS